MTTLKRSSLKLLILAALLISSAVSVDSTKANTKAANLSCSACADAVNRDIGLCYQLQAQANEECGINWIIDPCEVGPAQVCIKGCTCN
jgi:hypothetical protein